LEYYKFSHFTSSPLDSTRFIFHVVLFVQTPFLGGVDIQLSESLRRFRKQFNVTQRQAAQVGGITERNYQSYEYDKSVPTATILIKLADTYNVSLDYLVGRSNNPARIQ